VIRRTLTGLGAPRRDRGRSADGWARLDVADSYALGDPSRAGPAAVATDHPQAFGLLAALERAVRRWPVLWHSAASPLEGRRRDTA
jgi:hypothetical protein